MLLLVYSMCLWLITIVSIKAINFLLLENGSFNRTSIPFAFLISIKFTLLAKRALLI